jgi:hypothetical protein
MSHRLRASRSCPLRPLLVVVALTGATGAHAQTSPYYIGARQAITHDSNVFRDQTSQSDNVSSTGLLAGIDQPFGRQRFFADASVETNRHNRFSALNNVSYALTTGLDWSTIERLSGSLSYATHQNLADFGLVGGSTEKNVERSQQAVASVRYGIASRLGIEGSAEHRSVAFSNSAFRSGEYTENVGSAGIRWGARELLTFGVGLRVSKANYPHYIDPFDPTATEATDKLDRNDVDLTTTWVATGRSTIDARISSTREKHSQSSRPDFSGVTGSIGWDYKLTGKVALKASLVRDTGSETTFLTVLPGALPIRSDNNRLTTLAELGAKYEATAKIALQANYRRTNGSVTTISGSADDTTSNLALGVTYQPTRTIALGCNASHEKRVNAYNAYTAGCLASITLR